MKRNKKNYLKKRELKWKEIMSILGNQLPHLLPRVVVLRVIVIIGVIIKEGGQQQHMIIIKD